MKALTDANFESEINANNIVLVDFWAEWCAPCRMMAPILEDLSKEYEGRVSFAKVDITGNKSTAGKYKITAIPTMMLFKKGKAVSSIIGAVPKEKLKGMINDQLP